MPKKEKGEEEEEKKPMKKRNKKLELGNWWEERKKAVEAELHILTNYIYQCWPFRAPLFVRPFAGKKLDSKYNKMARLPISSILLCRDELLNRAVKMHTIATTRESVTPNFFPFFLWSLNFGIWLARENENILQYFLLCLHSSTWSITFCAIAPSTGTSTTYEREHYVWERARVRAGPGTEVVVM